MDKLAYIGDEMTGYLFKAVGVDAYSFSVNEVRKGFEDIVNSGKYGVIFVSEDYYKEIEDLIRLYGERPLPSILLLPALSGSKGYALDIVRATMKKAAGSDIMEKERTRKGE